MRQEWRSYLDEVTEQVRFREAHEEIRKELASHLDEARESCSEEEALARMGDPRELGLRLNEVHRPRSGAAVVALVVACTLLGGAGLATGPWLALHALWTGLGLLGAWAIAVAKPATLRRLSWPAYAAAAFCVVAAIFGESFEGQPYLGLGTIRIKALDASVLVMAIALASPIAAFGRATARFRALVIAAIALPFFACLGFGALYPATLLLGSTLAMLLASSATADRVSPWITGFGIVGTSALGMALTARTAVLQDAAARMATDAHTDFALRSLSATSSPLGLLAAGLGAALIWALAVHALAPRSVYGRTMSVGIAVLLAVGIGGGLLTNFAGVPMPATGVHVPFFSYGGSQTILTLLLAGAFAGAQSRRTLSFEPTT